MVAECSTGMYGSRCSFQCQCQNDAYCHHVTGDCACTSGYEGKYCQTSCNGSAWGVNCLEVIMFVLFVLK